MVERKRKVPTQVLSLRDVEVLRVQDQRTRTGPAVCTHNTRSVRVTYEISSAQMGPNQISLHLGGEYIGFFLGFFFKKYVNYLKYAD